MQKALHRIVESGAVLKRSRHRRNMTNPRNEWLTSNTLEYEKKNAMKLE